MMAVLLIALSTSEVSAQLNVDKSVIELSSSDERRVIRLSNSGEDTLYVNLELHQVQDPTALEMTLLPSTDALSSGILVHPRQLIIAPGQTRTARVVLKKSIPEIDEVYRLVLSPFAGDALAESKSTKGAGIRMLLGYKILVLVRPDELNPEIELQRDSESVRLVNHGNTNVLMRTLEACNPDGLSCQKLPSNRVYAGEVLSLDIPEAISPENVLIRARQAVRGKEELVEYFPE